MNTIKKSGIKLTLILALLLIASPAVLAANNATVTKTIPINSPIVAKDVPSLVRSVVTTILGVVGAIALAMFIYGGVMWMTSTGNQNRIEKGKETLIWATIGLLVIFGSYALLRFIFGALTGSGT